MTEVSVVIPCYNQGKHLRSALDSVAAQKMEDWEVIVIDDGSTDDTAGVAQGRGDPRIRYLHQENRGLSGARNSGIEEARGRHLAFLDADDEWEPEFLGRCLAALDASSEALGAYTGNCFIDADGRRLPQTGRAFPTLRQFRRRLLEGGFFPVHAALVRRTALELTGPFDQELTSLEDWDLWLRLSRHGGMVGITEPLARYRVYSGSMSTDAERMHFNRLAVLAKHFRPADGQGDSWSEERRYALAFAHRAAALGFLEQGRPERCWPFLEDAANTWPGILERLDTYYELGCGSQVKGARGWPAPAEIEANGQAILSWLDGFFSRGTVGMRRIRGAARGQAYLALAILADQAGDWRQARRYSRQALSANPRLVTEASVLRRTLKLHAGKGLVNTLRPVIGGFEPRAAFHNDATGE